MELALLSGILRFRGAVIGGDLRNIGCPLASITMLLASVVNRGSTASSCGLLSPRAGIPVAAI